jgi:hypothetical protein
MRVRVCMYVGSPSSPTKKTRTIAAAHVDEHVAPHISRVVGVLVGRRRSPGECGRRDYDNADIILGLARSQYRSSPVSVPE